MHYQYIYGETDDLVKVKEVWLVEGVEVMALIQSNFFLFKVNLHRSFIKEGRFDQASSGCISVFACSKRSMQQSIVCWWTILDFDN